MVRPARMKRPTRAVRVGQTACGLGVFARRRFLPQETIAEIRGEVIVEDQYWSAYCIDLGGGAVFEPAAPLRFLNHSCRPNCELVSCSAWDDQTLALRHGMRLRSLREIRAGEQLTIDYAWPPSCAIPCLCGNADCRGWIVARDQLHEILDSSRKEKF